MVLGAEVRYYNGISRMAELKDFRIEGSKLLLLEMPSAVWTEYMIRELIELSSESSLKIMLAHSERYLGIQNKEVYGRLLENDILMQVNADFFASFSTKRRAVSMLNDGKIHFIGSDSHNTISRPPNIGKAFDVIRKKMGDDFLNQMNEYGNSMLNQ
jgi:protein-tyrosine phosphatase